MLFVFAVSPLIMRATLFWTVCGGDNWCPSAAGVFEDGSGDYFVQVYKLQKGDSFLALSVGSPIGLEFAVLLYL